MRSERLMESLCVAVGLVATVACASSGVKAPPEKSPHTTLAVEFATAIAAGDYERAHTFLSSGLRSATPASKLQTDYTEMVSYGSGVPTTIAAMTAMDSWPEKQPGDVEWVYVAIANDTYSEAVTVVVAQENDTLVIRSIEWGRP